MAVRLAVVIGAVPVVRASTMTVHLTALKGLQKIKDEDDYILYNM